ncbi:hypothetical protein LSAT2_023495 [Lamellibrachia satsuma]|nr:hypothetical protein LSAT2_023495 [Lamellibrachia satsuma]
MNKYSVHNLMSKVNEGFEDIFIDKLVFNSSLTSTKAIALLNDSSDKVKEIRCAAMALRTEILAMSPSNTLSPASVHTLKGIPPFLTSLKRAHFKSSESMGRERLRCGAGNHAAHA